MLQFVYRGLEMFSRVYFFYFDVYLNYFVRILVFYFCVFLKNFFLLNNVNNYDFNLLYKVFF